MSQSKFPHATFSGCGQGVYVFGSRDHADKPGVVVLVETCCYYRALYAIASASRQPLVCIAWLSHSSKALDQYKEYKGLYINTLTGEEFTLGP